MERLYGKNAIFFVKKNDNWFPLGCLVSSPISENVEMIDTTTRDNNGWRTNLPTVQGYSIDISGVVIRDDIDSQQNIISFRELRKMKRNRELIEWKIEYDYGWYVDLGKAYITDISVEDEVSSEVVFSATFLGFGEPTETSYKKYVLSDDEKKEIYSDDNNNLIQTDDAY